MQWILPTHKVMFESILFRDRLIVKDPSFHKGSTWQPGRPSDHWLALNGLPVFLIQIQIQL